MASAQTYAETDVNTPRNPHDAAKPAAESAGAADAHRGEACPSRYVLGMRVDGTSYRETAEAVAELVSAGEGGLVCASTVHMAMECFDDPEFQNIVNSADRVTPDGVPIVWALRLLGIRSAERVYGPSLLPAICGLAQERGLSVGFYGGSPEVSEAMVRRAWKRFPGLDVAFAFSPPFRALSDEEDRKVTEGIEGSGVDILFIGLGCPKQERWVESHRKSLSCVMVAVGAGFDFFAGHKAQAPTWMQSVGLEWFFRLCSEPRRLWRRYLYHNPRFVFYFIRQWLGESR
jgi:N-acetylglucosaminyldiphosphoundecaprenol N-acetyl-beta-D-mannosaminyltransferase